ncbi:MAG: hypothetical protein ACKVW3_05635 [Phycisphaerales bacterium]
MRKSIYAILKADLFYYTLAVGAVGFGVLNVGLGVADVVSGVSDFSGILRVACGVLGVVCGVLGVRLIAANNFETERRILSALGKFRRVTAISVPHWPRLWKLMAFLLPKETRERVFDPAHADLLDQYLLAKRYRGKWVKRWLAFCFLVRTFVMYADCLRVAFAGKLAWLIPPWIRVFWLVGPGGSKKRDE